MRLSYQCPDCERSMTRADYNYSMDLNRAGRCAPCQWERDKRVLHHRVPVAA